MVDNRGFLSRRILTHCYQNRAFRWLEVFLSPDRCRQISGNLTLRTNQNSISSWKRLFGLQVCIIGLGSKERCLGFYWTMVVVLSNKKGSFPNTASCDSQPCAGTCQTKSTSQPMTVNSVPLKASNPNVPLFMKSLNSRSISIDFWQFSKQSLQEIY